MKKTLMVGITIAIVAVSLFDNVSNKENVHDLILNNIEALATGESGHYSCYGSGSVRCPIDGSRVAFVYEPFSLE